MKKTLITFIYILFVVSLYSQGVVTKNKTLFEVPKCSAHQLGIKYPYQIAHIYEYSYIHTSGAIQKKWEVRVGENSNKIILDKKILSMRVVLTSFQRSKDFITGLPFREYYYYPNDLNNIIKIDTILKEVKKQ